MQNLGEQRQRDHSSDDEESSPCCIRQAPEGVPEDSHQEARSGLSVSDRAGSMRNRLTGSGEKGVRVALRQEFERTLFDLGTDEHEFRVQLPRLDVFIRTRLTFGETAFLGL